MMRIPKSQHGSDFSVQKMNRAFPQIFKRQRAVLIFVFTHFCATVFSLHDRQVLLDLALVNPELPEGMMMSLPGSFTSKLFVLMSQSSLS